MDVEEERDRRDGGFGDGCNKRDKPPLSFDTAAADEAPLVVILSKDIELGEKRDVVEDNDGEKEAEVEVDDEDVFVRGTGVKTILTLGDEIKEEFGEAEAEEATVAEDENDDEKEEE